MKVRGSRQLVAACWAVVGCWVAAPVSVAKNRSHTSGPAACDPSNLPAATAANPNRLCLTVAPSTASPQVGQAVSYTVSTLGLGLYTPSGPNQGFDCGNSSYPQLNDDIVYTYTTTDPSGRAGPSGTLPTAAGATTNAFSVTYPSAGAWTLHVTATEAAAPSAPGGCPGLASQSVVTNTYATGPLALALLNEGFVQTNTFVGPGGAPFFGPPSSNMADTLYLIAQPTGGDTSSAYTYTYQVEGQTAASEPCPAFLGATGPNEFCGNFTPGQGYTVSVTVTDASGRQASQQVGFNATDPRYQASFANAQNTPLLGETAAVQDNVSVPPTASQPISAPTTLCGSNCTYQYTVTDPTGTQRSVASSGTAGGVLINFDTVGAWTITASATNAFDGPISASETVLVFPALNGAVQGPTQTTAGATAAFAASATGGYQTGGNVGYTYAFSVDGQQVQSGSSSTLQQRFATAGTHTVSVAISDAASPAHTIVRSQSITVIPAPVPVITVSPAGAVTTDDTVTFAGSVTGGAAPYTYSWDFGDGGTGSGQTIAHRFPAGTFRASLTVTDAAGVSATTAQTVVVTAPATGPTSPTGTTSPTGPTSPAGTTSPTGTTSPPGTTTPTCLQTVTFALTQATTPGCFITQPDGSYATSDGATINGIPLPPTDAAHQIILTPPSAASPGGRISVGGGGNVPIALDSFNAYDGPVAWDLPADGGADLGTVATLTVPAGASIKGLAVGGSLELDFGKDASGTYYSVLHLHVSLPSVFKAGPTAAAPSVAGDASIRVDSAGIHYDGLKVQATNVWLGPLQVNSVCFSFVPGGASGAVAPCTPPSQGGTPLTTKCGTNPTVDRWDGNAVLTLPTPSRAQLALFGGLSGGSLSYAGVTASNLGTSIPIVDGVFLTKVGVGLCLNPPPLQIAGTVGVSLLPASGTSALSVDGAIDFTDANPWTLQLSGSVSALGGNLPLGSGSLTLTPGSNLVQFSLSSSLNVLGIVSITGAMNGWLQTRPAGFNLSGSDRACIHSVCATASGVVSSVGIAGCLDLGSLTVYYPTGWSTPNWPDIVGKPTFSSYTVQLEGGFGYDWGDSSPSLFGGSCDFADYSATIASAAAADRFDVRPGTNALAVRIRGLRGAPNVDLKTPSGRSIPAPSGGEGRADHGRVIEVQDAADGTTSLLLLHPQPGIWKVSAALGSTGLGSIQTAASQAPAVARGAVDPDAHAGHRYLLGYGYILPRGERLKLFVINPGKGVQSLGFARGSACATRAPKQARGLKCGHVVIKAAPAPAGTRTVYGLVYRHGMPQRRLTITTFHTPAITAGPAKPKVRVVRTRGGLKVSWTAEPGAARYAVAVTLSDGRVISQTLATGHSTFIASVGDGVTGRVQVWAISATVVSSKPGAARIT